MTPIDTAVRSRLCTGCGACAAAVPHAIHMHETATENRRPHVRKALNPAETERAMLACPAFTDPGHKRATSRLEDAFGPVLAVYQGCAADPVIRHRGSSGGAVTATALAQLLTGTAGGVLHIKADREDPTKNKAALSRDRRSLLEGAGSRYAPASVCDGLPLLRDLPGQAVVIGKPCDIQGMCNVDAMDRSISGKIALKVAIFCAGTPSREGTKALLDYLGEGPGDRLQILHYRGEGWPGPMKAQWLDASGKTRTQQTDYATGWGQILQQHRQWRCHVCDDHTGELADISVGDPWQTPPKAGDAGKSLIIVRTPAGQAAIEAAIASGHLTADRVNANILFDAQPNLVTAKGAVWGRSLALSAMGLKAPRRRASSLRLWRALGVKDAVKSVLGTFKRVIKRRLFRPATPIWF